ncbi:MAG: ComEC/Rec2 family competence protein [Actinomycetota bacterium]
MAALARTWIALGGLVAGVLAAPVPGYVAVLAAAAGAGCCARRRGGCRALGVVAIAFALGALNATLRAPEQEVADVLARGVPSCRIAGRTLEDAGGLGVLAALDRAECANGRADDAGAAFLDGADLAAGRSFAASGWLIPLRDGPFDSARRRAGAAAAFRATATEDLGPASALHGMAGRVRAGLATSAAPLGRAGQLLRGLTIGDTAGIDPRTEGSLRRSGLAHLLAVSGSNVAILLGTVALALRSAPFRARVGVCAATLAVFVLVVGPDASVLRAAAMGAVALAALAYGKRNEPLHALGLALVALVALRPGIVYSTGLHLSAAATAGIVLWTRPLAARLGRLPRPAATVLAATVAAQCAVAPLLVAVFGRIPLGGLPANVFAVAAVPPATVLGLAAAAVAPVAEAPAALLARAASPFAAWILYVGDTFGAPAWASVAVPRRLGAVLAVPAVAAAVRAVPVALRRRERSLEAGAHKSPESR